MCTWTKVENCSITAVDKNKNHVQSTHVSLTHVAHLLPDVNWETHNANLPHNILIKRECFVCGNKRFCSLLASEPRHTAIVAISGFGALSLCHWSHCLNTFVSTKLSSSLVVWSVGVCVVSSCPTLIPTQTTTSLADTDAFKESAMTMK